MYMVGPNKHRAGAILIDRTIIQRIYTDLNAIEHVWSWMVQMVKQCRPTTHADLRQAILDVWYQIPLEELGRYCNHIGNVLPNIIESGDKLHCTMAVVE